MKTCPLCNIDEYAQEVVRTGKEPDKTSLIPLICDEHLCEAISSNLTYVKDGIISLEGRYFGHSMDDHKRLLRMSIKELQYRVESVAHE